MSPWTAGSSVHGIYSYFLPASEDNVFLYLTMISLLLTSPALVCRFFTTITTWEALISLISSLQLLSHVQLFVTPWTEVHQASLPITNSQSLLKLMSIESVMPYNHLILCRPLLLLPSIFPSLRAFPVSQFFTSGGQSIGVSASTSVLLMNIPD